MREGKLRDPMSEWLSVRFHLRFFVRAARLRVDRLPEKGMPLPMKDHNGSAGAKTQTDANTVS